MSCQCGGCEEYLTEGRLTMVIIDDDCRRYVPGMYKSIARRIWLAENKPKEVRGDTADDEETLLTRGVYP